MGNCVDKKQTRFLKQFFSILCICAIAFMHTGCTPLKKKFIRQKKKDKQVNAFIPVLDPIDYPPAHVSAQERYAYHYSLWRVWDRDLIQKIDSNESDKTQIFLLKEVIAQLVEMKKWVTADKQSGFDQSLKDLNAVLALYEMPPQMRSKSSLKGKLERISKKIRNEFNPEMMKESFIN